MKKILTKNQQSKKDRMNQLLIGVVLIGLMLFSTLGYALGGKDSEDSSRKVEYNGITFTKNSDYWIFNYNQQNYNTRHNPEELKDIVVPIQTSLQDYNQKPLYFIGEVNEPALEIIRNLNPFVLRVNSACLPNTNCTNDAPVKNPSVDNIFIIQEPKENQTENVYQQENAIFITASFENQTKYADAVLFKVLRI